MRPPQIVVASNAGWDRDRSWQYRIRETARTKRWGYLYAPPGPHASWISPDWVEQQKALLPAIAFERVILNRWTAQSGDYISREAWRRLIDPALHPVATGAHGRYFGGLDLGLTRDRTAFATCHVEGQRVVLDALEVWEGSPDNPVSIVAVENFVRDAYRRFPGLQVVADPWQAEGTVQKLSRAGLRIDKFRFSQSTIAQLSRVLYECVQDESLRVFEDMGLEQEILGLQVRETAEGWRFDHRAGGYSDRVVALAMALQAAVKTRRAARGMRTGSAVLQKGARRPRGFRSRSEVDVRRTALVRAAARRRSGSNREHAGCNELLVRRDPKRGRPRLRTQARLSRNLEAAAVMKRPRPLVYATARAASEADLFLPGGAILEDAITAAIQAGNVSRADDDCWYVYHPSIWRARVRREPGRLRPRPRTWTVLSMVVPRSSSSPRRVAVGLFDLRKA